MRKRIISTGISAVLIGGLLLTACGGNRSAVSSSSASGSSETGSAVEKNSSVAAEDGDPFGKYDPSVKMTFARTVDNDLNDNILPKTPGETIESNRWLDLYSKDLGIDISYAWTVRGGLNDDAYTQKLNVTIASGDLPDVLIVNRTQLKQLAESDMIADMTVYYDKYASKLTKEVYNSEGPGILESATFNERLMAVPYADASVESTQYLWLRQDWLDKLNLEPPKTMQDLLKIAKAFTTLDPDGNGKDDTYAMAITKNLYSGAMGTEGFFAGYHSYPNMWVKTDEGTLAWGSVLPETKEALRALAEMYAAGEIDPEFGIKDGAKVAEMIAAGKLGINFGEQWNPMYPLISNYQNDPEADWVGYPIVSIDDTLPKVPQKFRTQWYYAVRKDYANPEAVVKLINLHLEKNWGENNEFDYYYMPAENGAVGVWKFSPVAPAPTNKNLEAFNEIQKARKLGDMSILKGEPAVIQGNLEAYYGGDTSQWGWEKIYGPTGVFNALNGYIENGQVMREEFVGAPTPTMVDKQSSLRTMELEMFVRIIMGDVSIDEFDKFVENWNALGGAQMTKEVNEWYQSIKN
ncbi:carbohydrate ABC transporter substrate-binding protein, CUT1 family [Lacrimispora sphenoides]|jgi:putative aldouronate transport system substrate-binding protein|uniref:extracellular solute-binding protein n=1 Tax=Lacrimispora sphenoides TaxID=29370 RepID=UPI0008C97312|nr:extracellular solute-binding protein [Lacrimispora sphenoides]SEU25315.1 carbohydrate ABC transporter substrate-binding protein, CUT1 family [Lacrimispora sphenoides]